jgi:choline-glycine betaine transporter
MQSGQIRPFVQFGLTRLPDLPDVLALDRTITLLPFFVIGFLMIWSLVRALRADVRISIAEVDTMDERDSEQEEAGS